jgi:hypothetical protein
VLTIDGDVEVPFYIIPFDKRGLCVGPETRRHLLDRLRSGGFSDIFFFSHGWNNDWTVAVRRYEDFIEGFAGMRRARALPRPAGYKPLLVGIFWPSTALVFTEKEKGPQIAAGQPQAVDEAVAEERLELEELAEELDAAQAAELYELTQKTRLTADEAWRLAEIATVFFSTKDDELGLDTTVTADELLEIWRQAPAVRDELDEFIAAPGPQTAGFLSALDPRNIVRTATVRKMKDRAGLVGGTGVHALLRDILDAGAARVHAIGHSYGAKIVLSATCAGPLPKQLHSMLLLQPALSHLAFAATVPSTTRPGGYHLALTRVRRPILATYSRHDFPLTKLFHLTVRRKADLGEARIAAAGQPPSKYAALGGFGPRHSGEKLIDILDAPAAYQLDENVRLYGVDGSRTISGHGAISNESTWWALNNLMSP